MSSNLKFTAPVPAGDTVVARVRIDEIDLERKRFHFIGMRSAGVAAGLDGDALIMVPCREDRQSVAA